MKIISVTTWFEPKACYVENFATYAQKVDAAIVVDDSGTDHASLLHGYDAIYVGSTKNTGIAAALNHGSRLASEMGADWVLTMDQDSSWDDRELQQFLEQSARIAEDPAVAIIAPNFESSGVDRSSGFDECAGVISAGSLVRLSHFHHVGGYNDALFIDQVDFELCYRLRRCGRKIIRINDIVLRHAVGEMREVTFLGRTVKSQLHSASRKYYMTRNALYMRAHFRDFPDSHIERILLLALGVLLLETEKASKLRSIAKGISHHYRGVLGKLR